jgi:hypothetical protein
MSSTSHSFLTGYSHQEIVKVEGVIVEENPGSVTQHFQDKASDHGPGEPPHSIEGTLDSLNDQQRAKKGDIDTVSGDRGLVSDIGILEGAGLERTLFWIHDEVTEGDFRACMMHSSSLEVC